MEVHVYGSARVWKCTCMEVHVYGSARVWKCMCMEVYVYGSSDEHASKMLYILFLSLSKLLCLYIIYLHNETGFNCL